MKSNNQLLSLPLNNKYKRVDNSYNDFEAFWNHLLICVDSDFSQSVNGKVFQFVSNTKLEYLVQNVFFNILWFDIGRF